MSPLLANIALHVLDEAWEREGRRLGVLVRYADDFVVVCPHQATGRTGPPAGGGDAGPARAAVASRQDQDRRPPPGAEGFDFLGFHHRMVESRKRRGRYWLNKWPSPRAMASIRGKVRDLTAPRQVGLPPGVRGGRELNPVLRGWGAYFRQGNSSAKFGAIDSYVHERMARLASRKHALPGINWTDRFNQGLARPPRHLPAHRNGALSDCACLTMNDVGEPCAGEPHARFDRGPLERTTSQTATDEQPTRASAWYRPERRQTSGLPHLGGRDYRPSAALARASMPGVNASRRTSGTSARLDRTPRHRKVGSSAGSRVRRAAGRRVLNRQDRRPPVGANYKRRNRTTPCRPRPAWRARSASSSSLIACDNLVKRVKLDRLLHLGGGARVG